MGGAAKDSCLGKRLAGTLINRREEKQPWTCWQRACALGEQILTYTALKVSPGSKGITKASHHTCHLTLRAISLPRMSYEVTETDAVTVHFVVLLEYEETVCTVTFQETYMAILGSSHPSLPSLLIPFVPSDGSAFCFHTRNITFLSLSPLTPLALDFLHSHSPLSAFMPCVHRHTNLHSTHEIKYLFFRVWLI